MSASARLTAATCKKDGPCSEAQGASERDKFVRACKQVQKMSETAKVSGCKQVSRAISAEVEVASKFMAPASPRAAVSGQKANGDNGCMDISNQYGTDSSMDGMTGSSGQRVHSRCLDVHPENHFGDSKGAAMDKVIHLERFVASSTKMPGQIEQFENSQQIGGAEPSEFSAQVRVKRKSSDNDARDDTTSCSVGAPELRLGPKFSDGGPNQKEVTVQSADSTHITAQNGTLGLCLPSVLSPRSTSSTWKRGMAPRRRPSRRQRRQTKKTASTCSVDKLGGARQEPEQEEAIVHHALVGAVNSKANLANSQDGGDEIMWEIMLPWVKDHSASWNWSRRLTWSESWRPGASAFVRDRMAEIEAAVADRNSAADGHATHTAKVKPDKTEQLEDRANAVTGGRPDAKSVHTAMASALEGSDNFVPTDAERQRRLNRPLHQKRTRDKSKPERLVELWMDSGASENLGPLDEVQANTKNQQDLDKEQVLTADANAAPLEVHMRGDLFGKIKVEKGHNKAVDVEL